MYGSRRRYFGRGGRNEAVTSARTEGHVRECTDATVRGGVEVSGFTDCDTAVLAISGIGMKSEPARVAARTRKVFLTVCSPPKQRSCHAWVI